MRRLLLLRSTWWWWARVRVAIWRRLRLRMSGWSSRHAVPLLLLRWWRRPRQRSPTRNMSPGTSHRSRFSAHARRSIVSVRIVVAHHQVGIVIATVLGLHWVPRIGIRVVLGRHALARLLWLAHVLRGRPWWTSVHSSLLLLLLWMMWRSVRRHVVAPAVAGHHRRMWRWSINAALVLIHSRTWSAHRWWTAVHARLRRMVVHWRLWMVLMLLRVWRMSRRCMSHGSFRRWIASL